MRMSRQAAHEIVVRAAGDGLIELLPNRDDRRVLQLELTSHGRSALAWRETEQRRWLGDLLLGLSDRDLATVNDVLRGLRARLVRAEQRSPKRRVSRL